MSETTTVRVKTEVRNKIKKECVGSGVTIEEVADFQLNKKPAEIKEIIETIKNARG